MTHKDQEQHRIPRVYLTQWSFTEEKTKAKRLCVMKRGDAVSHYKTVKNFTTETNLFDTTVFEKGSERYFDEKCKYVENNYNRAIKAIQSGSYDRQTRIYLTEFISNIFVRQKSTFNYIVWITPRKYLRQKFLNEITFLNKYEDPALVKEVFEQIAIDLDHTLDSRVSGTILQAWKHFNTVFGRFTHTILKSPTDRHWFTTDNPVIVHGFGTDAWIAGPDAEVYFPISKEFLIYLYLEGNHETYPLTRLPKESITQVSLELYDDIMMNVIIKSKPDYFILGEDQGYYNAKENKFETYYRPIESNDSFLDQTRNLSLIDTPLPPNLGDPDLELLLDKMNAEFDPEVVPVETHAAAQENECIAIVDLMVNQFGGKRILGWQIWKGPYLIKAEFHAVWETSEGELKDVSLKKNFVPVIVFVADSRIVYEGKQINSIRINLSGSDLVDDFIEVCNQQYRLFNKGKRGLLNRDALLNSLTRRQRGNIDFVANLRQDIWRLLDDGGNEESPCFCNSGRKYKNCHSKTLASLKRLD